MADAKVLLGRSVARALNDSNLERSERFTARKKRQPKIFILTSEDPSAQSYLKSIRSTADKIGIAVEEYPVKPSAPLDSVIDGIHQLNKNASVDGILIQTPMPEGIDFKAVARALDPAKDIDGVSPAQAGLLFQGVKKALAPSTARACIEVLDFYKIGLQGAEVVVIGRSLIVGRPVALLALSRNATVTWCHTKTESMPTVCKRAEILIAAAGKSNLITSNHVRPGATVIDVGINVDENGKLSGDVNAQSISSIAAAYTPVPGGIGPVTVACLFANLMDAVEQKTR
jgi:methylenetetrahydrofolate dehydrogenase (NADP+) / methenyltetrahydrofolate cyclohydrolase